jgi:CBS domain-containing protein
MNIGALVRRKPETVEPRTSCAEAARVMRDLGVGTVVVVEQRRPLGMLTDRDLVVRVIAADLDPDDVTVAEAMSDQPIFVAESCDVTAALGLMRDLAIRRVAVVDEQRELVGVVSLDDVLLTLAQDLDTIAELVRKAM